MKNYDSDGEGWKEKYISIKKESLVNNGVFSERFVKFLILFILLMNFGACFTGIYEQVFERDTDFYLKISKATNFSIPQIEIDMRKNAAFEIFGRYVIFSIVNLFSIFLSFVFVVLFVRNSKKVNNIYFFVVSLTYTVLITLFFFCFIIFFNGAGYDNSRFPFYPALGKGVFFFIRDTFFYYLVCWLVVEMVVQVKFLLGARA